MKKLVVGFLCGSLFFSGVSYAASGSLKADIANLKVLINGTEQKFSSKPVVIDGTTYLPLREVSKAFGYSVNYKNETITLNEGQTATPPLSSTNTDSTFTSLPETIEMKVNINGEDYTVNTGGTLFTKGDEVYSFFSADGANLFVAIASNDYLLHEGGPDSFGHISIDYHNDSFTQFVEVLEKKKSYRVMNPASGKTYEALLNKDASKGVSYLKEKDRYLVPLNKMFKDLGLNLETKYDANKKQVSLILK